MQLTPDAKLTTTEKMFYLSDETDEIEQNYFVCE